jgi:hypothetical protein
MGLLGTTTQSTYYSGSNFGDYQFVSLDTIINNFMYIYVGENKIINKVNRSDVQFHGMRAVQELSYDVLKSFKTQEIEVPNTLAMVLPQDYVNYTKIARVGTDGIERVLYPTRKTSNPFAITQDGNGSYTLDTARRKVRVTIPANGASDITDGDYVTLLYTHEATSQSNYTTVRNVNFIFDKNDSTSGGPPTSISVVSYSSNHPNGTNFHIPLVFIENLAQNDIANRLTNDINSFGHHKATNLGSGIVEIEYLDGTALSSTTVNSATTEGAYANNVALGGSNGTNLVVAITQNGSSSAETLLEQSPSNTLSNFESQTTANDNLYDINSSSDVEISFRGRRYGLDPEHAQMNGSFFIDNLRGKIHFGSALSGETIILHYVSDGLGTDSEMVVHKFCEEACYKHIMYGVLSGRSNIPEYIVQRFKKERFAETRKAKIRLSNIKIEEFTQVLKGLSKQIK